MSQDYLLYYACCQVQALAPRGTLCWMCLLPTGLLFYDSFEKLPIEKQPIRGNWNSSATMRMSQVRSDLIKKPHP